MGNTFAKLRKADWVDGGRVKEKILADEVPIAADSWGVPIYAPKDYDTHLVKKLIRQRRLAPFYDPTEMAQPSDDESEDSFSDSSPSSNNKRKIKRNRKNKDDPEAEEGKYFDASILEKDLVDCPICLLSYPRNINYTECCKQAMCTSCFVKIKRPTSGRIITCPFCNHLNFSVLYHKPRWLAELAKAEELRDEGVRPDPVACEGVKVNIVSHERIQQRLQSRTQPRYYYAQRSASTSSSGNGPRRYVFYEPSGSYTFYDNQYYRTPVVPVEAEGVITPPTNAQPSYYQNYQHQEFQRQQSLRARAEEYERNQLEEAIRRSMIESGEAAEEYAAVNSQ